MIYLHGVTETPAATDLIRRRRWQRIGQVLRKRAEWRNFVSALCDNWRKMANNGDDDDDQDSDNDNNNDNNDDDDNDDDDDDGDDRGHDPGYQFCALCHT